jgi:hypothetical protein
MPLKFLRIQYAVYAIRDEGHPDPPCTACSYNKPHWLGFPVVNRLKTAQNMLLKLCVCTGLLVTRDLFHNSKTDQRWNLPSKPLATHPSQTTCCKTHNNKRNKGFITVNAIEGVHEFFLHCSCQLYGRGGEYVFALQQQSFRFYISIKGNIPISVSQTALNYMFSMLQDFSDVQVKKT